MSAVPENWRNVGSCDLWLVYRLDAAGNCAGIRVPAGRTLLEPFLAGWDNVMVSLYAGSENCPTSSRAADEDSKSCLRKMVIRSEDFRDPFILADQDRNAIDQRPQFVGPGFIEFETPLPVLVRGGYYLKARGTVGLPDAENGWLAQRGPGCPWHFSPRPLGAFIDVAIVVFGQVIDAGSDGVFCQKKERIEIARLDLNLHARSVRVGQW